MLALLAFILLAAPAEARPLSLKEALLLAQDRNLDLAAERHKLDVARAGIDAAGQWNNPTVGFNVGPDDPTVVGVIDVKLPIFGQRGAAVETARRELATQEAQVALAERRLRAQARRAYYALAAAQGETAIAGETAKLAGELAQLAQKKFDAGQAARIDVEQAVVAEKRALQDSLDRASNEIDARQSLAQLLGLPPDEELRPTDALLPAPAAPELASLQGRVGGHAELLSLSREREAALARADVERVAIRPVPDVSLQVERLSGTPNATVGLRAGVAFEVPILSQNRGKVHQAEAQAAVAEAQLTAARQRLQSALRAAFARWQAAAQRAQLGSRELLPAAERLLATARDGFTIGRTPFLAVVQAQAEVANARKLSLEAAADAQRAFADLEESVGSDL